MIRNVCVVGAGTMGGGIAAHLANLGFRVTLLDTTVQIVNAGFDRAKQAKPPHFYLPERASEVRLGSVAEYLNWVGEADWVIEAIVERPEAKRELFQRLETVLRPDAFISSNTSGLEIASLAVGRSDSFRRRFLGTHFFNPPRRLKLIELIPTNDTSTEVVGEMTALLEEDVARRVVLAKDTPGFIANRYGMWAMFHAIHTAERLRLAVEDVDAITGPFLGRPRSGSFRLADIIGIDVMRDIGTNLLARCANDPHVGTLRLPTTVAALLERGWIGEKAGQGYTRREGRDFMVLDLDTLAYRQRRDSSIPSLRLNADLPLHERISKTLDARDEAGEFLRLYLIPALRYAAYLRDEVSHGALDFDRVMKWGFGWEMGPFEMIDAIGGERLGMPARRYYEGGQYLKGNVQAPIPVEPRFAQLNDAPVIHETPLLRLRDLGDGVTAVSWRTKQGVVDPAVVDDLTSLLAGGSLSNFVLVPEGPNFSLGYDLKFFADAISRGAWGEIEDAILRLQSLGEILEKRNAVAAVRGWCLGGGFELAWSCPRIVADAEAQIGLPEAKVGLIPGGRGTVLLRLHNQLNAKRLSEAAVNLATGRISGSADEARALGFLRPTDITSYHPDALLWTAKQTLLGNEPPPRPEWQGSAGPLVGMVDRAYAGQRQAGAMTEYDVTVGDKIKGIFAKSGTYADAVLRERTEFLDLCTRAFTQARIRHMLEHKTPLRN
ncbi:3-hydroxyacyl-CoA dehydrogenase/enoyl-CoA hydratase family protein [soil metagenome]